MSFLRKNFVWILLAVVLVVEGVFAFMLLGKKDKAEKASGALTAKQSTLAGLRNRTARFDERVAALKARRAAIDDERGECVLDIWARGQFTAGFFESEELAKFEPTPWRKRFRPGQNGYRADELGLFRLAYQKAYDAAADALADTLTKMKSERTDVGFVAPNEFTKEKVTLGDIYREQKDFWVRKEIVGIAAQAGVNELEQIAISLPIRAAARVDHAAVPSKPTSDAEILVRVRCPYRALVAFLEGMTKSPLGFHVRKVDEVLRQRYGGAETRSSRTETPGEVDASAIQGVEAKIYFRLPITNVAIQSVTFSGAAFKAGKSDVAKYVSRRIAALEKRRTNVKGLVKDAWRAAQKEALKSQAGSDGAAKAASEGDAKSKTEVVIHDELMGGGRDYTFGDPKEAARWIEMREAFEAERLTAHLALWRRVQVLLAANQAKAEGGNIVVEARPEDQFDKAADKRYVFVVDRKNKVRVTFGLLTFAPELSDSISRAARIE